MFLRPRWLFGLLALSLAFGMYTPVGSASETSTEVLAWAKLINAVENQPTQPATMQSVDQFLTSFPQSSRNVTAQFMRGELLFRQGEFVQALAQYQGIPALASQTFGDDLLYRMGECAYNLGRYPQAQNYWDQLYVQFPNSPLRADVLAMRGRLLLEQNKNTEAALAFRDLLSRYPHYTANSLYALGRARLDQVLGHAQQGLDRLQPFQSPETRYWKSVLLGDLHRYAAGTDLLETVWRSPKEDEKILLGGLWLAQWLEGGQWALALAATERLETELSTEPILKNELLAVRGHCLFKLQRFADAVAAYTNWLGTKPEASDPVLTVVYQNLAQAYYALGNDTDAMNTYKKHLQTPSTGREAAGRLHLPLRLEQAYQDARKKILVSQNPRVSSPWLSLVATPPILSIQPPRTPQPINAWTLLIADEHQTPLNQQSGGTPWPEKLTWAGDGPDGRQLRAGEPFHYTFTVTDKNGKALSTPSSSKTFSALSYTRREIYYVSVATSAFFEKENGTTFSAVGHSLIKETATLCLTHARQGLRLEISAVDPGVGERQAQVLVASLQAIFEWPNSWIAWSVVPSQGAGKESVTIQCIRP